MKWPHELRSLGNRDLRLFFIGQSVSLLGSWIQPVATQWLAWRLSHSNESVARVNFFAQLPTLLLGLYAGSIADRFDKRKLVTVFLVNATVQAALLAALTFGHVIQMWHLFLLSAQLGVTYAFEIPARQSMLADMAGADLDNVVAMNATVVTVMRVLGPLIGGLTVAAVGEAWCFSANAVSFLFVLAALWMMRTPPPIQKERTSAARDVLEGLGYALRTPMVRAMLLLLVFTSVVGLSYGTLMPVVSEKVLGGGAALLGRLLAFAGVGALFAALTLLTQRRWPVALDRLVGIGATVLGIGLFALSRTHSANLAMFPMVLIGYGQILVSSGMLTLLQTLAPAGMRGRVMGLFTTIFIGAAPFGALAVGKAADRFGASPTLMVQALIVLAASFVFHAALRGVRRIEVAAKSPDFGAQLP